MGVGYAVGRDRARFYLRDRSGRGFGVSGSTVLTDGLWHHVVAIRDAADAELRLYVDGILEGSTAASYSSGFVGIDATLNLGWVDYGGGYHFRGELDEVAFHRRALSQAEITAHYESGGFGRGYFEE